MFKCDVAKYFPSIDHAILKSLLARKIKDGRVLDLAGRIIDGSNPQDEASFLFPGDDLFTAVERRRGLPLGNQTSQFFANVYLNPFDHFVKEQLRPTGYVRYVDDFVIFGQSSAELVDVRERCREKLAELRLRMHPRKCTIGRVADGTRFLGLQVFPTHCRPVTHLKRSSDLRMTAPKWPPPIRAIKSTGMTSINEWPAGKDMLFGPARTSGSSEP